MKKAGVCCLVVEVDNGGRLCCCACWSAVAHRGAGFNSTSLGFCRLFQQLCAVLLLQQLLCRTSAAEAYLTAVGEAGDINDRIGAVAAFTAGGMWGLLGVESAAYC